MGEVWLAGVDPELFDYVTLCAYTQATGRTHAERRQHAEQLIQKLAGSELPPHVACAMLGPSGRLPLPRTVAVKISRHMGDPNRFGAEWRNLIRMDHPNVIRVFGGGTFAGTHYYAMEHIQGLVPVAAMVEEFSLRDKLDAILQAAHGLAHLHENGVIHRDIKPSNLLTYRSEQGPFLTKVADLGVCKFQADDLGLANSRAIMGTPCYMSPEQVVNCRSLDHRSDIYSLGASLYELLTGRAPHSDCGRMYETMAAIVQGRIPVPPEAYLPSLPPVVGGIVRRAMAYDAGRRYQSAHELAHDLTLFLADELPEPTRLPAPRTPGTTPPSTAILVPDDILRMTRRPCPQASA